MNLCCILISSWIFIIKVGKGDHVSDQHLEWKLAHTAPPERCTDSNGIPYPSLTATLSVGTDGPPLFQDRSFYERTASFNRERIPERVVHAQGTGAHGTFTVTHDVTQWTKAKVLNQVGKRTPAFIRISTTSGEVGFPDTLRDPRGFGVRFYTEDGNWDIVGNQIEVINIRDPIFFAAGARARKRNPATHLFDQTMAWDFIQSRPESALHTLKTLSDIVTPESLRMINGSGVNTFKLVNNKDEIFYCKFHFISQQKFELMTPQRAAQLAGNDPIYLRRELYNAIASTNYPRWTFAMQVATVSQAENYRWDYLDNTKHWRFEDFPLIPIGVIELNRNPSNVFTEVESIALSPANFVPGIEASADRILESRIFTYPDAQRYRLGVNFNMIPINKPLNKVATYERDGAMCVGLNGGGGPNYFPNSFNGPEVDPTAKQMPSRMSGDVARIDTGDADNFSQPRLFIEKDLNEDARQRLATNIAAQLKRVTPAVRELVYRNIFDNISRQFGEMVRRSVSAALAVPNTLPPERE
ncbi:Catalase [Orchesella cincta]|uniref:Catalase n=1 Tax=Orchesella cincta TaxID=48709 RepID=A0A1D2M5K8_ORCCI|nr:Catalase [Orchesella cincta]